MANNIIFLDIDGVLNHSGTYAFRPDCHLDCANTHFLYKAVSQIPDVKIVISSSWRSPKGIESFLQFVHVMKGVDQFECLVPFLHEDYCTKFLSGKKRGYEIREWLSRHPNDVLRYICLDDDSDYLRDQPLLQIDREIGFSFTDQYILLKFFGVECNYKTKGLIEHVDFMMRYGTKILMKRAEFCKKYIGEGQNDIH